MARNPTQKGDLTKLSLLMREGGMAFGLDQQSSGQLDTFGETGGGAIVLLEGGGGISMDAVSAPLDHPSASSQRVRGAGALRQTAAQIVAADVPSD